MNLSFQTPLSFVLLFVILSFTVSYYLYRYTIPQVSAARRTLLVLLRGTALTLILLSLCEPIVQLITTEEKRPAVALLVDNSLSMSQPNGTGRKEKILAEAIQNNGLKKLAAVSDLKYFSFSNDLRSLVPESLVINGGSTNISQAIQSSLKSNNDLQGIILLSDGNYNSGANPLYDAEKSRIPIFTVGIGDTTEQKDISVSKLVTNSIGYVDAPIPVDATIKVSGIASRSVSVALLEDGKKIDEKIITTPASNDITEIPIQFLYNAKSDGTKKLSVAVAEVEGEITSKNNSRAVLVKILKNKLNITVIAGTLSADVSAIMQTLNADNTITATLLYQLPNGEFKSKNEKADLQSSLQLADAVIVIGFPSAQTSSATVQKIEQIILSRSLSILYVTDRMVDASKLRLLESVLPFTIASERIDEQIVLPSVVPAQKNHQVLQQEKLAWEKLPPLFYSLQTFSAKPEAQILLSVKIQNVPLNNPLFVIRTIGSTKSAAMLGYGIHRWKIMAGSAPETKGFFSTWVISLVRWLATKEQDKFLRVEPSKEFYSYGERIEFTGQVYNESYTPVDNADVLLSLRSLTGPERFETTLSSFGSGLYQGSFDGLSEGEYAYTAAAILSGDTLGTTAGRISIGEQSIEFSEIKMNKAILKQIANASGGMYADASSFTSVTEQMRARLEMKIQKNVRTSEFELWNLPSYLAIIILLFGIEWLLRKQFGML